MRRFATITLFLLTFISSAQSADEFMHTKGYLVKGMATLQLAENRTGWWRLSAPVAVRYGLEVSEAFDQRRDPIWSTEAAAEYWSDLYDLFDDTVLADDAFVNGPAHARVIAFDALAYLEMEDQIARWKEMGNDSLPDLDRRGLKVSGSVYWTDAMDAFGMSEIQFRSFRALNPSIMNEHLELNEDAYLRFQFEPSDDKIQLWRALGASRDTASLAELNQSRDRIAKNIPDPSTHDRIIYRVKSGDFLGTIANRYHVPLSDLKKWNNLNSDIIRIGQELVIYAKKGSAPTIAEPSTVSTVSAQSTEGRVRSDEESREEVKYKVKTGDTLWSIARAYPGVSADDIMRWNGIDEDIREGQELLILIPEAQ